MSPASKERKEGNNRRTGVYPPCLPPCQVTPPTILSPLPLFVRRCVTIYISFFSALYRSASTFSSSKLILGAAHVELLDTSCALKLQRSYMMTLYSNPCSVIIKPNKNHPACLHPSRRPKQRESGVELTEERDGSSGYAAAAKSSREGGRGCPSLPPTTIPTGCFDKFWCHARGKRGQCSKTHT